MDIARSVPLIICEETHRRVRRHRVWNSGGQLLSGSALLPRAYQLSINDARHLCQLDSIDFKTVLPGQAPAKEYATPHPCIQGDFRAHGAVMIDLPGEKHSGPLSLRTLQHRVAHSTSGSPLDTVFFKIRSTIVFEDPVDWPEAEASDARHFHTFTPLSRTSSIRLLNVAGLETHVMLQREGSAHLLAPLR